MEGSLNVLLCSDADIGMTAALRFGRWFLFLFVIVVEVYFYICGCGCLR